MKDYKNSIKGKEYDHKKIESMVETINRGEKLPAIVVCGDEILAGKHRYLAHKITKTEPEIIEISDDEYCEAMDLAGLDPVYDKFGYDFAVFIELLHAITGIDELADQY